VSDAPAATIRQAVSAHGGQATLFRSSHPMDEPFQPLPAPLLAVQQRLKKSFDPFAIFNPGRMYKEL